MGAVDTTYTFTATDTITSSKMNNIIDQTTMTPSAIIGTTLEVASGQLKVRAQGITSNEMGTSSVTTDAIANNAVTPAKLSSGGPSWTGTGAAGIFSVPQTGLEFGTGHTQDYNCFIDLHSAATPTDFETRIVRNGGANGNFEVINQGSGVIKLSSSGGVAFGSATMFNPVGTAPVYGVRAWANFNGRVTNGNCEIRSSGNVSTVVRTAPGKYTVTFVFAMPNTNYAVIANSGSSPGSPRLACADRSTITTTTVKIETDNISGAATDFNENNIMVIA